MPDVTAEFLERLGRDPTAVLPPRASGTIRLDVQRDEGTEQWFVTVETGKVQVFRQHRKADVIIRGSQAIFDRLVRGEAHLSASVFRKEVTVEGDYGLVAMFHRLLPGPPGAHGPRPVRRRERRGPHEA
ncbi:SCP2 sterol-binding domain-containing protein [Micromonospora sp. 15K316]|uniref:SCP2 sterol-binding domain-containing protein n=1 Tax=Micromonospora sp. 15K316 TaxID=2530376 RepID=UPI001404EF5C|nr:SCP2 sterol-binding domain-containing protein [Micromonospora sp. 15K316]